MDLIMGKQWILQTPLLFAVIALGTATGQEQSPNYILTAYPPSPVDGENMTLSCTERNGGDITVAVWFIGEAEIFQTSSDSRTFTENSPIYPEFLDRISVNTSAKQHNATLMAKASIDNGTVWKCKSGIRDSNNITIDINGHKDASTNPSASNTGPSFESKYSTKSSTNNPSSSPRSKGEELSPGFFENTNNIYIITAAAGGAVIVIVVIVVIVCVCVRKRRNKQSTEEKITGEDNKQSYGHNVTGEDELVMADNVLYGGYDDDINRTGPDKEESTTEKSTDRPRVVTDAYAQVNKVKKNKKGSQFQLQQESQD